MASVVPYKRNLHRQKENKQFNDVRNARLVLLRGNNPHTFRASFMS